MTKTELRVHCRRNGVTRDAGVHATYDTREEAELKSPAEIKWLKQWYDEVYFELVDCEGGSQ